MRRRSGTVFIEESGEGAFFSLLLSSVLAHILVRHNRSDPDALHERNQRRTPSLFITRLLPLIHRSPSTAFRRRGSSVVEHRIGDGTKRVFKFSIAVSSFAISRFLPFSRLLSLDPFAQEYSVKGRNRIPPELLRLSLSLGQRGEKRTLTNERSDISFSTKTRRLQELSKLPHPPDSFLRSSFDPSSALPVPPLPPTTYLLLFPSLFNLRLPRYVDPNDLRKGRRDPPVERDVEGRVLSVGADVSGAAARRVDDGTDDGGGLGGHVERAVEGEAGGGDGAEDDDVAAGEEDRQLQ
jgi:hypothetical protein